MRGLEFLGEQIRIFCDSIGYKLTVSSCNDGAHLLAAGVIVRQLNDAALFPG